MKNKKIVYTLLLLVVFIIAIVTSILFINKNEPKETLKVANNNLEVVLNEKNVPKYISGKFTDRLVLDEESALESINDIKDMLKITSVKDELYLIETNETNNTKYYELQQKYKGIDVLGGKLIISVDLNGNVLALNGNYIPNVSLKSTSTISSSSLKTKLVEKYGEQIEYESNKKIINYNGDFKIVYLVELVTNSNILEVYVEATTGNILYEETLINSLTYSYTGKGLEEKTYTINLDEKEKGLFSKEKDYRFIDNERNIILTDTSGIGIIAAPFISKIFSSTTPMTASMDANGNLHYWSSQKKLKSAVTGMAYYSDIYDYYKNVLGRKSYDNKGSKIIVNLFIDEETTLFGNSNNWENAAWMGRPINQFFIGSSNNGLSSFSYIIAKDAMAHEFTHAVIDYTANFKSSKGSNLTSNETGALDEAYADILGVLIENTDWVVAEKINETYSRDLTNPTENGYPAIKGGEYYYPDSYLNGLTIEQYLSNKNWNSVYDYDDGGVHYNSTVVSHAAYLMYKNGAFESKEQMAKVWYNSLFLLSEHSNFEDCALAVIQAAKNMNLSRNKIVIIENAFYETKILDMKFASLEGKVTDKENNKELMNVLVTAINKLNNNVYYETYSNEEGQYKFDKLPHGDYIIVFEKSKYNDNEKDLSLSQDTKDYNAEISIIDESKYKDSEIVFVMDVSLSMDTTDPNDIRKQIISNILSKLDGNTKVGLVTFTIKANIINNGLSDKSVDKKILMTDVFNIANDNGKNGDSGTNGRTGLETALSMFKSSSKARKYIVFLTDGVDVVDTKPSYEELVNKANELNVRIITIGLGSGSDIDETNLISIAKNTNGKYYHASNASKLYEFDLRIFEELD